MSAIHSPPQTTQPARKRFKRVWRSIFWAGLALALITFALVVSVVALIARVPASYPLTTRPISPPVGALPAGRGLDGFDSPYLGHTGSWDGKGGTMGGGSKIPDLEIERGMGLRWTFMAVYWRAMEPEHPVDLKQATPAAWQELDQFVIAAHERGLNILMQAPVVGGNAGGPPAWAGRREAGHSAPANMTALAAFAGKLADRYRPGGTLATSQGWGTNYGVRAWELDNEPASYLTSWAGQAADYAEFVTLAAREIKRVDPAAAIVGPGIAGGKEGPPWLEAALEAGRFTGSPVFHRTPPYSLGPVLDIISFHNYEGLDSAFTGAPRTIGQVFDDVREVFENQENRSPGFTYARKQDYWHTEGNFDFLGVLSQERRAAWRFQFFTRAFAAGIRKVVVMDASKAEQAAVRAYIRFLPQPFPMLAASHQFQVQRGEVSVFRHPDNGPPITGQVWVVWPRAGTGDAVISVSVAHETVQVVRVSGEVQTLNADHGQVHIALPGDKKMAPGVLIVDRSPNLE